MAWKDKNVQIGSLLGPGAIVDGHFKTNGSARIDGEVKGNVEVESTLIIGETGKVDGDVTALSVTIGGEVLGDVDAQDRVELMEGAKVLGDITTKVLVIDENAIFQGKCNMYQDVPNKKNKNKKPIGGNKKSAKAAVFAAIAELKEKEQEAEAETTNPTASAEMVQTVTEQNNSNVQNSEASQNTGVEQNVSQTTSVEQDANAQTSIASKLLGLLREEKNDQPTEKPEEISTFGTMSDQTENNASNATEQTTLVQGENKEQNSSTEANSIPGINTSLLS